MAKRGWRATHRVRFRWENGVGGTEAKYSLDSAELFRDQLLERAEYTGMNIDVTIEPITRKD